MERPDLATLVCVNPDCHQFRQAGQGHLVLRNVDGHDRIRLWRCRTCGEAFSERRGSALFHTQLPEATAEEVIHHLDAGGSVRATARLVQVGTETVARLLRVPGRHAERWHDRHVRALPHGPQYQYGRTSQRHSRLRNQRNVRKILTFAKATRYHRWMRWLSVGRYNFCRPHSSLKITQASHVMHRSPAMAARLTDHLWSTREWLLRPVLGGRDNRRTLPANPQAIR